MKNVYQGPMVDPDDMSLIVKNGRVLVSIDDALKMIPLEEYEDLEVARVAALEPSFRRSRYHFIESNVRIDPAYEMFDEDSNYWVDGPDYDDEDGEEE